MPAVLAHLNVALTDCWQEELTHVSDYTLLVLARKTLHGGEVIEVVEVSHPGVSHGELVQALMASPNVADVSSLIIDPTKTLAIVQRVRCRACGILDASRCVATEITFRGGGAFSAQVICPSRRNCQNLIENLNRRGLKTDLLSIGIGRAPRGPTARQREILSAAIDLGFFESPRKTPLGGLAGKFGVSKATIGETLRRALKKVLLQGPLGPATFYRH